MKAIDQTASLDAGNPSSKERAFDIRWAAGQKSITATNAQLKITLFGEACDRCGTKTRHKLEDKAICEFCEQVITLLVEAKMKRHEFVLSKAK